MKKIKIMADYECYPLWLNSNNEIGNINPDTLPISNALKEELNTWSEQYDETLCIDDPLNSGFLTSEAELAFKQKGYQLKDKLQSELGKEYEVIYQC